MVKALWSRIFGWTKRAGAQSRRFGNYHIMRIVHDGEKATVYEARSPDDGSLYAIKVYRPEYDRTARRIRKRYGLKSEGEYGMMLNPPPGAPAEDHPIVRTVAYGREYDEPTHCTFIVQEFVEGFNVKHLVGCADPLLRQKRIEIARAVARAIGIIHERGLIHRDVCTDNILLARDGRTKLIDLGFVAPQGLHFEEKSGTPSYMSPEQASAKPLRSASDVYSFGVVLFELFTGRLPFTSNYSADNPKLTLRRASDLMLKHMREPPPRPSSVADDLPDRLDRIIMQCMEKQPSKRYSSMRLLLSDLSEVRERKVPHEENPNEAAGGISD